MHTAMLTLLDVLSMMNILHWGGLNAFKLRNIDT